MIDRLRRLAWYRLSTERADARLGQLVYFVASPLILIIAIRAVVRFASTPWEILLGVMAAATLSLILIAVGLVLPLAASRPGLDPARESTR